MGKRFLIGMHGRFGEAKLKRDFREGFYGIEICQLESAAEIAKLKQETAQRNISFGVHYPMVRKERMCRDPLLIHPDEKIREGQWREFEDECRQIAEAGAAYVVIHTPKPVLVDRSFDTTYWRFGNDYEWIHTDCYDSGALAENLWAMFDRLNRLSKSIRMPIYLEPDLLSTDAQMAQRLAQLLGAFPNIGVCLDTGRLHLQACIENTFNPLSVITLLAPFVRHVHLWNTNLIQNQAGGHYPVLPELQPAGGWADMPAYFKALNQGAREYTLLFEHRSDWITDEQLEESYEFAEQLIELI